MLILKKCQHISCFKEAANILGCVYVQVFLDDAKIKDTRIFFSVYFLRETTTLQWRLTFIEEKFSPVRVDPLEDLRIIL